MIHLNADDGTAILVNPLSIFAVRSHRGGSRIIASGGAAVDVKESLEEVDRAVKRWTKVE